MKTTQIRKLMSYLNKNINSIKKLNVENYHDKSFIHITTNNTILNVIVSNKIIIEVDESVDKHFINFYSRRFSVENIDGFKVFFDKILAGYKETTRGLFINYKNKRYQGNIELVSIDKDRGMGTEKIFDINIIDSENTEHVAAQVSEYPVGIFNVVHIHDGFNISENEIENYFHDNYNK